MTISDNEVGADNVLPARSFEPRNSEPNSAMYYQFRPHDHAVLL